DPALQGRVDLQVAAVVVDVAGVAHRDVRMCLLEPVDERLRAALRRETAPHLEGRGICRGAASAAAGERRCTGRCGRTADEAAPAERRAWGRGGVGWDVKLGEHRGSSDGE